MAATASCSPYSINTTVPGHATVCRASPTTSADGFSGSDSPRWWATATIGHHAIIHGCTVVSGCLIGMGSIVLDGAVIGDESFVAAGSLVTPGTIIPPRSFVVGRPAKVVRPVSDRDLATLREAATRYVQYAGDFRDGCKRIDG